MGKLISKFFQIRRVLKLCPFLMLTLLLMLSIIFIAGDRYGYKFYPNDEQKLAMIIIGITVVLSLISILSMTFRASIKTYSSSVLPLFALAFSFCVYLGTNITKDTFLLMCGAVTGCSFFVCVFCGRKGFIKQLIILITIIAVAGHFHDGAFAKLLFNLLQRCSERFSFVVVHGIPRKFDTIMAQGPEMEQKLLLTPAAQSTANLHNTVHINSISISNFCARNSQMPFLIVT